MLPHGSNEPALMLFVQNLEQEPGLLCYLFMIFYFFFLKKKIVRELDERGGHTQQRSTAIRDAVCDPGKLVPF